MPPSKTFKIKQNDTNTADVYEGEFQVTYADSSIQTFPNDGYILIDVKDDVE